MVRNQTGLGLGRMWVDRVLELTDEFRFPHGDPFQI